MNSFKTHKILTRALGASAIAASLALSAIASAQPAQLVGTTYTPAGANYSITALQGITSSNLAGQSGTAQVDLNFEEQGSIGAAYSGNNGQLQTFGIGLYQNGGGPNQTVASTGLDIQYNTLVSAASANFTLEDFDLKSTDTAFNYKDKVAPSISIYGANNALIGTATPMQVMSAFTNISSANDYTATVNAGTLLSEMGASNKSISKVVLFADNANGEKPNSDPYELQAVGKAQPVPEPASLCGLAIGGLLLRRRKAKANA